MELKHGNACYWSVFITPKLHYHDFRLHKAINCLKKTIKQEKATKKQVTKFLETGFNGQSEGSTTFSQTFNGNTYSVDDDFRFCDIDVNSFQVGNIKRGYSFSVAQTIGQASKFL